MIDLLNFIFMDGWHFAGSFAMLYIILVSTECIVKVIGITISNIFNRKQSLTTNTEKANE